MPDIPMDSKEGLMSGLGAFIPVNINPKFLLDTRFQDNLSVSECLLLNIENPRKLADLKLKLTHVYCCWNLASKKVYFL